MKHILTTNEPFLLERGTDLSKDLTQATTVQRFEDVPWLNYTDNNSTVTISLPWFGYMNLYYPTNREEANWFIVTYLNDVYEVSSSAVTSTTTELGKIIKAKFTNGSGGTASETFKRLTVADLTNDRVYMISVGSYGNTYTITDVYDYKFSTDQIYSVDREFGTHLWFKFGLLPWIMIPDTSLSDTNPQAWVYEVELRPLYWDQVRLCSNLVQPLINHINGGGDPSPWYVSSDYRNVLQAYLADWCNDEDYTVSSNVTYVWDSPNIYWDFRSMAQVPALRFKTGSGLLDYSIPSVKLLPIQGRFVAGINNLPITSEDDNMKFPDTNPAIISGHTYEFNIFDGVFNLIDITQTTS